MQAPREPWLHDTLIKRLSYNENTEKMFPRMSQRARIKVTKKPRQQQSSNKWKMKLDFASLYLCTQNNQL